MLIIQVEKTYYGDDSDLMSSKKAHTTAEDMATSRNNTQSNWCKKTIIEKRLHFYTCIKKPSPS